MDKLIWWIVAVAAVGIIFWVTFASAQILW